ncbi:MAG: RNA polymerase sigma factor [Firmicutes bacterium]|nr:RNA polymerase sigma factor [Bacillota bacterium]
MEHKLADELIEAVAHGDMGALEILYYHMYREIYLYIFSLVHNRCEAEDLAQDTFMRVYKYAPNFTPQGKGKSWIYKIANHLALTYLKSNRNATSISEITPFDSGLEENAVNSQALLSAINKISDSEQQIVLMHAVSGLTLGEIAEITNLPLGTVKWKHANALKKLRKILGENFI